MKKVGEISWKTGIYNQTMKYNYNFSGEISWDTAYQMEGSPVQKKVKVVICVCVGGGGREDNSKPFNVANAGMLSGKGWCHSYFLFLLQIFVGSPMYLIIEG